MKAIHSDFRTVLAVSLTLLLAAGARAGTDGTEGRHGLQSARMHSSAVTQDCVSVSIPAATYQITGTEQGHEVSAQGFGRLLVPGKPDLPSRIFAIAIPPGAEVVKVTYDTGEAVILPGIYRVPPAALPRVIGPEDPVIYEQDRRAYEENFNSVYGGDNVYPQDVVEFVRTAGYRKYNLVDVRVTPFAYQPLSGRLTYYPEVTVHVHYRLPEEPVDVMVDHLARTESVAEEIIINHEQAREWYAQAAPLGEGLHDFVIITLDSLTSSLAPLVDWETRKGRTVEVVTTSWIDANYDGYDLAEKMRNLLREKYPSGGWGVQDVLLVGDYDDVPMRRIAQDFGYGEPETDLYYAELTLPDSESWDADGDHQYAEDSDPIDFYSEVVVGRIPYSDPDVVESICMKSYLYERHHDPSFKKNILLLGSFFWPNTDNAVLMEAKVDQPWMSDWTMTRMYEEGHSTYAMDYDLWRSTVVDVWSSGSYVFVNWAGHGSPTSTHIYYNGAPAFITADDSNYLNDDYPSIIFADACSNSDTDAKNIGMRMLKQGSVGFLGATKVSYGMPGWDDLYDGSSQSFDYLFTTAVTCGNYTQGQAHQWALREMYTNGLWYRLYYEMCEWGAYWGNPDLGIGIPPIVHISFPDGLPDVLPTNEPGEIIVQIDEGDENYIPGSGLLHYRYDGGEFQTLPLEPLGDNLYLATLPTLHCGDVPEFYFSAEGDISGVLTEPPQAPDEFFAARVGAARTVVHDNFETDQGWIAENLGATSGDWERGIPVYDLNPMFYAPVFDSDGSGQCFLTENDYGRYGETDVDDGAVRLTSPMVHLFGCEVTIRYDYWVGMHMPEGVDWLLVEIDENDGAGPWKEIARHALDEVREWQHHTITHEELVAAGVTPTATMKIRFTANDADPQSIHEAALDAFDVTCFYCSELLGDINCDGVVNFWDINPFVMALTDPEIYAQVFPDCPLINRDINGDGEFDFEDINPFVGLLTDIGG